MGKNSSKQVQTLLHHLVTLFLVLSYTHRANKYSQKVLTHMAQYMCKHDGRFPCFQTFISLYGYCFSSVCAVLDTHRILTELLRSAI